MASEQAKKAYPDVPDVEFVGDGRRESQRAAYDRGAVEALREAAQFSTPADHEFRNLDDVRDWLRAWADEREEQAR